MMLREGGKEEEELSGSFSGASVELGIRSSRFRVTNLDVYTGTYIVDIITKS